MAKQTTRSRTTTRKSTAGKKAPSAKKKTSARKSQQRPAAEATAAEDPGESLATIDRRRGPRRQAAPSPTQSSPAAAPVPALERRQKVNRRRQIDPTTCERDYTDDEVEFMNALDDYKRKSGRMFPTCSEVLEVIRDLGYAKLTPSELASRSVFQVQEIGAADAGEGESPFSIAESEA